ncbi:hypothetical protein J2128_000771 [Methanomicrobium sp. W14]|uniref:DUF371 domain-containing protein n=1 Tax=Methanomicrobium sp. W14 TaxID=2817839 RepID=UPI001AEADC45|nr:DUF371 domain-containing protein [Methanomicrobium sp. W14]MBP2132850.1 hypothetical protein [Methanomicrobium sp. W14]
MSTENRPPLKETEIIRCKGHVNVRAEHKSTFEITKDDNLSVNGTCIIGICADKGAADLSENFKSILSDDRSVLKTTLIAGDLKYSFTSYGSSKMTLSHPTDLVWRRSSYVCNRTIGIYSDSAAVQIPREIIDLLKNEEDMTVIMELTLNPEAQSPSIPPLREFFDSFE